MSLKSIKALRCLMLISILMSIIAHSIALFTNQWLFSEERMPNKLYKKFNMSADLEFLTKFTISGLWTLCQNEPGIDLMNCTKIDYFSGEEYTPDPNDSTLAIPYAAKRAAFFILISTSVLIFGAIFGILSTICRKKHVFNFTSGISLILSGLFILAGIVIYISTFKAEIGNKLRPKSSFQEATFRYKYGMSFMFEVASLMICEMAGTFSVFLYIRLHQSKWKKKFEQYKKYTDFANHPSFSSQRFPNILDPSSLPPPPSLPCTIIQHCTKHSGHGRRYSRSKELSRDSSPISFQSKSSRTPSFTIPSPMIPVTEPVHDYNYCSYSNKVFAKEATNPIQLNMSHRELNQDIIRHTPTYRDLLFKTDYPSFLREAKGEYLSHKDYSDPFRRTTPV